MLLGEKEVITTFKRHKRNINDKTIFISNENILLDMRLYEVDLPDVSVESLSANTISGNLWVQYYEDGFMYQILHKSVDHRTSSQAIITDDAHIDTLSFRNLRKITIVWEMCYQCSVRETSWV